MKVAIVINESLPLPSIKGGAIETGIQQIIDQNEIYKLLNLTVYSKYDQEAFLISKNFQNTRFKYSETTKKTKQEFILFVNKILRKIKASKSILFEYEQIIINDIKNENYDRILLQNCPNFVLPLHSKLKQKIIFLQLHNDYLNDKTFNGSNIFKQCEKIITVSEFIKKRVLTIPNSSAEKITVHKNCTDPFLFNKSLSKESKEKIRKKLQIRSDQFVILFTGRIIKGKGIDKLIEAVKLLNIDYKLLVIGNKGFGYEEDNPYLSYLKEISVEIKNKVVFAGFIPYHDLPSMYAIADVAVVPSILEEAAGRVVIEAQLSGLPLIVSDSGGIKEYITPNSAIVVKRDSDFVTNLAKAIMKIAKDNELQMKMKEEGLNFAIKFTPKRYYHEVLDYLK